MKTNWLNPESWPDQKNDMAQRERECVSVITVANSGRTVVMSLTDEQVSMIEDLLTDMPNQGALFGQCYADGIRITQVSNEKVQAVRVALGRPSDGQVTNTAYRKNL